MGADGHCVVRQHSLRPARGTLLVLTCLLAACGAESSFAREDAIVTLQTTGVTEAEATCMADTLNALGQIDVADPRRDRTAEDQEALVAASTRCVVRQSTPTVAVAGANVRSAPPVDPEPESRSTANGIDFTTDVETTSPDRREAAIARLQTLGRSRENASCIVDQLIEVYADAVFESANFGVGLDPFEAHAFAACA